MTAMVNESTESTAARRVSSTNVTGLVPVVTSGDRRWAKDATTTGQVAVVRPLSSR